MREFELIIDEALKNGLTPESKLPFNSQFLYECLGFRCGRAGLEAYKLLDNPLPVTLSLYYTWPFPQYLIGELFNILVVRDMTGAQDIVYSINDAHLVASVAATLSHTTYGLGTLMEMADFGEYVFMTNGVVMIYWNGSWNVVTSLSPIPMMRTICNFKSQMVGGCVQSSWYDCDETFYAWSQIGSIIFTPWQDNESGYRRCPFGGEVYHVRRLENAVIGYSSKGIISMSPVNDPVPGYGFTELLDIGPINRGAVGVGLQRHIYVGDDYILREVTSEGVKELGYQYYMEQLGSSEDIIITYNPSNKEFYIGNSVKTFLLSPYGMTETMQHPSAVWRRNKESYMLPDADDGDEPYLCSEVFDMGYKGQKTIFSVETDAMSVTDPEAAVDYANDLITWNIGNYKPINNMGIVSIITSGNMFRFRLRFNTILEVLRIGYMKIRYKMTDLKGIRGVHAPPPRGQ